MTYFNLNEQVNGYIKDIEKHPACELEKIIDPDSEKGLQQMTDLLTYLPEEQRKSAVVGFVMAMLLD